MDHFQSLDDPWIERSKQQKLLDILTITWVGMFRASGTCGEWIATNSWRAWTTTY